MELLYALLVFLFLLTTVHSATLNCPNALIAFGDSFSDPGNHAEGFPDSPLLPDRSPPYTDTMVFPYRASNGRLMVDFLAQALGFPLIDPYLQFKPTNYTSGVNFAVYGATARNTSLMVPFYLSWQVTQFAWFKANAAARMTNAPPFDSALYWVSIGINDFWGNYVINNYTLADGYKIVLKDAVANVAQAVERLYGLGARQFLVTNIPAAGCLPVFLSKLGSNSSDDYDSMGCLKHHNELAHTYSLLLEFALSELRYKFSDAYIMFGNLYDVHLEAILHPTKYGFDPNNTMNACCGGGGANHIPVGACYTSGDGTTPPCTDPDSFISWDGIHFTEGFYRMAATRFLTGEHVYPTLDSNLGAVCHHLDFSKFYKET